MRWTPGGTSEDIEDRRGEGGSGVGFGGIGGAGLGIGGTLILAVLSIIFRTDLFSVFGGNPSAAPSSRPAINEPAGRTDPSENREVQFVSFVLDDAQKTWDTVLPKAGADYRHAKLVLFRDVTRSGCGTAQSSTGPFYCPADEKVYIDLGFFDQLASRQFGAPGEFAQAYVIAHEIGHHVQKILGIEQQVHRAMQANPSNANRLSVGLELQADCLAGVWGNSTAQRNIIDRNDISAGLQAAASVGDDRLQKMSRGTVSPESFTHGSSEQRVEWFRKGLESGNVEACNTFRSR